MNIILLFSKRSCNLSQGITHLYLRISLEKRLFLSLFHDVFLFDFTI